MNKIEFLNTIEDCLKSLEKKERDKFVAYYEEIIEDYKEHGYSEEKAIDKIGDPQSIAEGILAEQDTVVIKVSSTGSKIINTVLLVLGFPLWGSLLLAAIMCILSIYVIIWCVPFTTGVATIGVFTASLVSIIGSPFVMVDAISVGIVQFGVGIIAFGISILLGLVTVFFSKKLVQVTRKFTSKLSDLLKKKVVRL